MIFSRNNAGSIVQEYPGSILSIDVALSYLTSSFSSIPPHTCLNGALKQVTTDTWLAFLQYIIKNDRAIRSYTIMEFKESLDTFLKTLLSFCYTKFPSLLFYTLQYFSQDTNLL
jgi:hypothetical protein